MTAAAVPLPTFAVVVALYVAAVLAVGIAATRRATSSPKEYFLAGRGLGTLVLFMALFGTNATAFVLVGVPGLSYRLGIGVFGLNAPIVALGIPLTFWAIGVPARRIARRLGALTPAELYARRLDSRAVGYMLFAVFAVYTLPYMVTAVKGAAITLERVTDGAVSELAGGTGVLLVALLYTSLGGMRATAWTNVLQGTLFLGFMIAAFFMIGASVGEGDGLRGAMQKVARHDEALLVRGEGGMFAPAAFASWGLAISLTVIAFPHMLVRLVAADSERSIRNICRIYPGAMILLWVPAVMLGVWGAAEFPGLTGADVDTIFARMVGAHLPGWLASLGFLAVLAAVMSTLDAQILTLGSMLKRDVLDALWPGRRGGDVAQGRLLGIAIAAATFAIWRLSDESIFDIASVAFSGYVTLVPVLFLGVRWRRFNAPGALLSIALGNAVYFASLWDAGGLASARAASWLGCLPVVWGLAAAAAGAVAGTLLTRPTDPSVAARALGEEVRR